MQWNNDFDREKHNDDGNAIHDYLATGPLEDGDDEVKQWSVSITGKDVTGTYQISFGGGLRVYRQSSESEDREKISNGDESDEITATEAGISFTLYVDGVSVSGSPWDQSLTVTFTPSGEASAGDPEEGTDDEPEPATATEVATVIDVDLKVMVNWWEEDDADVSGLVPLNKDHDEEKGGDQPIPDHQGEDMIVSGDSELQAGTIIINPAKLKGTWTLSTAEGTKVWTLVDDEESEDDGEWVQVTGGTLNVPSEDLASDQEAEVVDLSVMIEGVSITTGVPGEMKLTFAPSEASGTGTDELKLSVLSIDLVIPNISEYEEDHLVALIPVNDDHDEQNSDGSCSQPVTDNNVCPATVTEPKETVSSPHSADPEDEEVVHATLTIGAANGTDGKWWLSYPNGHFRIYEIQEADTGTVITPAPSSFSNARQIDSGGTTDLSVSLLIEGISSSSEQLIVANFVPDNPSGLLSDSARVEAIDIDVQLDIPAIPIGFIDEGLNEWEEQEYGAFIQTNADFSKGHKVDGVLVQDFTATEIPDDSSGYTEGLIKFDSDISGDVSLDLSFPDNISVWIPGIAPSGKVRLLPSTTLTLPASQKELRIWVEGLASTGQAKGDSISVEVKPISDYSKKVIDLKDEAKFAVVDINAAVDGDRDGTIDHANVADSSLIFWYNNDHDGDYELVDGVQSDEPLEDILQADGADGSVSRSRDLEDLAPFNVFLDESLIALSSDASGLILTTGFQNLMKDELRINLFRDFSGQHTNALSHVTNQGQITDRTTNPHFSNRVAKLEKTGPNSPTIVAPPEITAGYNPFLFEAVSTGPEWETPPPDWNSLGYEAEIRYPTGRTRKLEDSVMVGLNDIRAFYDVYEVLADQAMVQSLFFRTYPDYSQVQTASINQHEGFDGDDYVLLVHGWNVTPFDKAASAQTAVKRMYWQGYTGRFGAFNWPTLADELDGPWPVPIEEVNQTYNASELQAFRSGAALKNVLAELKNDGREVTVIAHSMGNVVAGEALRLWSNENLDTQLISNYVAMEAAVSSGAYGNDANDARFFNGSNRDFYHHFPTSDVVTAQTADKFLFQKTGKASGEWYNIHNEHDNALGWWEVNNWGKHTNLGIVAVPSWPYIYRSIGDVLQRRLDDPNEPWTDLIFYEDGEYRDAYEVLAFLGVSNAKPLGQIEDPTDRFININLNTLGYATTMVGGLDRSNHSYQFHYDIHTTWAFWKQIKAISGGQ